MSADRLHPFRISADWPGGGFTFTRPFADAAQAHAWAQAKTAARTAAEICVTPVLPAATLRRGSRVELSDGTPARVRSIGRNGVCELARPIGGFLCYSHVSALTAATHGGRP
jgi:hypothetical protein